MEFSVQERFLLMDILPRQGSWLTMKRAHTLREALDFSAAECDRLQFREETAGEQTRILWNEDAERQLGSHSIEIDDNARALIAGALQELDKRERLTRDHLSLCEKFLERDKEVTEKGE